MCVKAAVLYAKGDIRCADYQEPQAGPGLLKIRVRACGICGSDIPRVLGDAAHYYPVVLGHEFSGEVVDIGADVSGFEIGDRIAGAPLIPCLVCSDCQRGSYSQCKHYSFIGSRQQGALAEYVVIPARNAIRIADNVSYEMGALFEPATVALHGVLCADFKGGGTVAILGGGNIGLLAAQWCQILGAQSVTVFDIDDDRLALAKKLGADKAFNVLDPDFESKLKDHTQGIGFDYVFETAGQSSTIKLGFDLTDAKGSMCCIGTPSREVCYDAHLWEQLNRKEFRLTGSWMSYSAPFPGKEWHWTAHYFSTGQLKLDDSMIFRKFPLCNVDKAFELYKNPSEVKGKVLILNND